MSKGFVGFYRNNHTVVSKADAYDDSDEEELFAWLDIARDANDRT